MNKKLITGLALASMTSMGVMAKTMSEEPKSNDPYIWLEEVEGKKALEWVEKNNEKSLGYLQSKPLYKELYAKNLEVYNSDERIPYVSQMGDFFYNFWRDDENPRGLWRRTTLEEYKKENPEWEIVLNLDELAEKEDENWVYKGTNCLYPDYDRCLINLSRGGADATVVREFDMNKKSFVEDGFQLPEAKSSLSWIDKDTLYVGTDFGKGSMTDSGYPRVVKVWERGQPLEKAKTVFEGEKDNVWNAGMVIHDGDEKYQIIYQGIDFYSSDIYMSTDHGLVKMDRPKDSDFSGIINGQLLLELKSDWTIGDKTYKQASLLSISIDDFMAGKKTFTEVLVPDSRTSIASVSMTKDHVLVTTLKDVSSELYRYTYNDGEWSHEQIDMPELGTLSVTGTSDEHNNFFINYQNFLTPSSLYYFDAEKESTAVLKSLPEFFDASPYKVEQHFAEAKDGTKIPYFLIMAKDTVLDGKNPTLLFGYGGFEVSLRPSYSATVGIDWLEQGGVYALANIRGGGEYGPAWHQAALKENRHIAFSDFIRVAEDLIERKVTSKNKLGIRGGSNGGLLVGTVATMRPDLYEAVVCQVPLLDMKRFNKLLAGASWMGEYGNPDNEDEWNYIKTYSPYHNVDEDTEYPKIFFTTSTRDDRVHPGHARKMVAKMTDQGHDLLYYENTEGGHGGAANNEQSAKLNALVYTYLADQLMD
ncbi:prolyl oligopeptidase family serine peptidase [Kangiella sediminilitoris]|uniref:Prolyl oligopeptidase n=1 Tax=Kangiella sediminilitoris TaxID=1144748 RepID=A0A1B3BAC9_9GAMM|nr:prolyl oligopeptidase family serine peptidase [Kangiella sediminilitoris]AOE49714.1 prolyl oligopeptidase [Kangiella sediminilitoris]